MLFGEMRRHEALGPGDFTGQCLIQPTSGMKSGQAVIIQRLKFVLKKMDVYKYGILQGSVDRTQIITDGSSQTDFPPQVMNQELSVIKNGPPISFSCFRGHVEMGENIEKNGIYRAAEIDFDGLKFADEFFIISGMIVDTI